MNYFSNMQKYTIFQVGQRMNHLKICKIKLASPEPASHEA